MSCEVILTQDRVTIVDDTDYEWLNQWEWCFASCGSAQYATRGRRKADGPGSHLIYMHRVILGDIPEGFACDHVNGNGLDNRRENLRLATSAQNNRNRKKLQGKSSRFKGVSLRKRNGKWISRIMADYRDIYIGSFDSELDAARAYNRKAVKHFGEFAVLNDVP